MTELFLRVSATSSPRNPGGKGPVRNDIQRLRGFAIGLVLLHHGRFAIVSAGFLGVDIFFVISGFLMGQIIEEALKADRFLLGGFYLARFRRLAPAACSTLLLTALVSPFLLDPLELRSLAIQLVGCYLLVANFVLWRQVNYFDGGAVFKPLLHMWSLAIESQYYLSIPFLFIFVPYQRRVLYFSLWIAISLSLCLYVAATAPSAAFYLFPTRAWELGVGTLTALVLRRRPLSVPPLLRMLAWGVLAVVASLTTEEKHPGFFALVVCLATALLMVPQTSQGELRTASTSKSIMRSIASGIKWMGDRSYSLYLVHWPLYAFADNLFLYSTPLAVRITLLMACFVVGEAQFRWVETPFRRIGFRPYILLATLGAAAATSGLVEYASVLETTIVEKERQGNLGFGWACIFETHFEFHPACESSPKAETFIWGDSVAMALVQGFAATTPSGVMQATKLVCSPFMDIAPVNARYPAAWGRGCLSFNDSVMDFLSKSPEIHTVILSSTLSPYIPGAEPLNWRLLLRGADGHLTETASDENVALSALERTVLALRGLGKQVLFVAPPPKFDYDPARCLSRFQARLPTIPLRDTCDILIRDEKAFMSPVRAFLDRLASRGVAPIFSLDHEICDNQICRASEQNHLLYADGSHLSSDGSRFLAERYGWGEQINSISK